jgi:hypothetical protein
VTPGHMAPLKDSRLEIASWVASVFEVAGYRICQNRRARMVANQGAAPRRHHRALTGELLYAAEAIPPATWEREGSRCCRAGQRRTQPKTLAADQLPGTYSVLMNRQATALACSTRGLRVSAAQEWHAQPIRRRHPRGRGAARRLARFARSASSSVWPGTGPRRCLHGPRAWVSLGRPGRSPQEPSPGSRSTCAMRTASTQTDGFLTFSSSCGASDALREATGLGRKSRSGSTRS